MKIWVIGRNYPLPQNGMQGSFELEQAKMLSNHGNKICYLACCLHPTKRIKGNGFQVWNDDTIKVFAFSSPFLPRIFPFYFNKLRNILWRKLFRMVEEREGIPDVIHIHYPAMLMVSDAISEYKKKGVRIVGTEHWSKVLEKKLDIFEIREYEKYKETIDKFICVGSPLAKAVKDLIGIMPVIVPNIVNPLFKPVTAKHDGFRFVAVGRLVSIKQFDLIIEAFCECFKNNSDISLQIIGGGDERDRLQSLIDSHKLYNNVNLLGSQTRERTAELVSSSDSLICYSKFETFGVTIIEAWACGLATIATDAAAVVIDNFDERLGVKVSIDDYEGLKKSLRYVYEHRKDYDKSFISNYAKMHFSEEEVCKQLMYIYGK